MTRQRFIISRMLGQPLKIAVGGGLCLLAVLAGTSALPAWSDKLYFYDGSVMEGKIDRTTGELITLKGGWGQKTDIRRITLAHRHDMVKTATDTYVGEILYIDTFRVEMRTENGFKRILRLFVDEISLGDPSLGPDYRNMPGTHLVDYTAPVTNPSGLSKPPESIPRNDAGFRPVHFQPVPLESTPSNGKPLVYPPLSSIPMDATSLNSTSTRPSPAMSPATLTPTASTPASSSRPASSVERIELQSSSPATLNTATLNIPSSVPPAHRPSEALSQPVIHRPSEEMRRY